MVTEESTKLASHMKMMGHGKPHRVCAQFASYIYTRYHLLTSVPLFTKRIEKVVAELVMACDP